MLYNVNVGACMFLRLSTCKSRQTFYETNIDSGQFFLNNLCQKVRPIKN